MYCAVILKYYPCVKKGVKLELKLQLCVWIFLCVFIIFAWLGLTWLSLLINRLKTLK